VRSPNSQYLIIDVQRTTKVWFFGVSQFKYKKPVMYMICSTPLLNLSIQYIFRGGNWQLAIFFRIKQNAVFVA
jgi:hypothetical protein